MSDLEIAARLLLEARDYVRAADDIIGKNQKVIGSLKDIDQAGKKAGDGLEQTEDAAEDAADAVDELGEESEKSGKKVKKLGERAEEAGKKAGKSVAAFLAVGAAVGTTMAVSFVNASREAEGYELRLNKLLGSQAEGNRLFKEMAKFASEVPFALQDVMASATQLAGVMKGGVNEVVDWMPLIADLAAVSGLSIQQTTDQVARMYASGANSADLFRERGILSMLGFQAGVAVSAEETKATLIEAFETPASKFRGAALDLASSWDGLMSQMGDKWFNFRLNIMDEGLFEFLKELAKVVDEELGGALSESENNARDWANTMIDGIGQTVLIAGGLLDFMDMLSNGLDTTHNGILLMGQGWSAFSIAVMTTERDIRSFFGASDELLAEFDRSIAQAKANYDGYGVAIAQNNLDIIERAERDWTEWARAVISRAEQAAEGVQAANDVILSDSEAAAAALLAQEATATAAAQERAAAAKEAYEKEVEAAESKLSAIKRITDTEREKITAWRKESLEQLKEFERLELITREESANLRLRIEEQFQSKLEDLDIKAQLSAKKALEEQLENATVFGVSVSDIYYEISDVWNETQGLNTSAALESFDDILDAFKRFAIKMAALFLASGLDKLFGLGKGDGFSFTKLIGGTDAAGGTSLFGSSIFGGNNNSNSANGTVYGGTGNVPNSGGGGLLNNIGNSLGLTPSQTQGVVAGAGSLLALYSGFENLRNGNEIGGALSIASGGIGAYNAVQRFTGGDQLGGRYVDGIGAASDLFGIYSGLKQGGPLGYTQAGLSGYRLFQTGQGLGLWGSAGDVATAFNPGFTGSAIDIGANTANTASNAAAQNVANSGVGGAGLATNALGTVAIVGGLKGIADGLERGGRRGYAQAGAGAIATYGGAAAISNGALAALGPYGWAAMAVLSLLSLGGGREWEQIVQEDYLPDVLGNGQAGFSALGAGGEVGFNGGNTAVFGANYGIEGSGITEQFSADGGENGNYAFFTGAQRSLDGFEEALRAAGITDINNTAGTLSVTSSTQTVAQMQEIWRAYAASLEEAVPAAEVFATAVAEGLLGANSHAKLFFENFSVGLGQNAFEARASLLEIDAAFDTLKESGMASTDALFQAISDHYGLAIEDAKFFVEQSGVSTEQWVANFSDASGELLSEMLDFNAQGETAFEGLGNSATEAAANIESDFGGAFERIRERMRGLNFDNVGGVDLSGLPVANGAPAIQSFDVGTPRLINDGIANVHKDEMIIDARSADALRRYGVQATVKASSAGGDNRELLQALYGLIERIDRVLPHLDLHDPTGGVFA